MNKRKRVVVVLLSIILFGCVLIHENVFFIPANFKYGKLDHSIKRKVFGNDSLPTKEISAEYRILSVSPDTLILTKLFINNELCDSIVENIRTKKISRTQFITLEGVLTKGKTQDSIIHQTNTRLLKKEKVNFGNQIILESNSETLRYPIVNKYKKIMSITIRKKANWKDMEGNIISRLKDATHWYMKRT